MTAGIDFSVLDRISAQDSAEEDQQERREEPQEEQISFLQAERPILAPPPPAPAKTQSEPEKPKEAAPERNKGAFTDHSGSRDYNLYYRIAHDYHKAHTPPVVEAEYWRTHTPGEDDIPEAEAQYWIRAAEELGEASAAGECDPFLMDLLSALYVEMEREYKAIREEAHRSA